MDLFESARGTSHMPLAARMRPRTIDEIVGQDHLLGPGKILRRALEADRIGSMILYGPPGSGKTTLAEVIARSTKSHFVRINAVTSGVAEIRRVVAEAGDGLDLYGRRTIVFIDEVHRFNRAQQDALLPSVEEGVITLIGATTENPFHDVVGPLVSRSRVIRLEPLSENHIRAIVRRAVDDGERGLGRMNVHLQEDALDHLAHTAEGDARAALNALELAALTTPPVDGAIRIDLDVIEQSLQRKALRYDRAGDSHYDTISAFIKSMRGSDPDATLHYLARMLEAGEDPRFIARRLMIHASEDVGLSDPTAILVAAAAAEVVDRVGLPEARLALAQAALHIALAPKSNAVLTSLEAALRDVKESPIGQIPVYLRDASYPAAQRLGHGKGYLYPHDYPLGRVDQQYLPDTLRGVRYLDSSLAPGLVSLRAYAILIMDGKVLLVRCSDGNSWTVPSAIPGPCETLSDAAAGALSSVTHAQVDRVLWICEDFSGKHLRGLSLFFLMSAPCEIAQDRGGHGWHRLEDLNGIVLEPSFLAAGLRNLPETPEHIVYRASITDRDVR